MATRVHRPLKVLAFNADGIGRQRYEISKQLQELHIDVALLSETHLKPHKKFFIPNYNFYRTDRFPGRKGGTAVTVRKGITHYYVALPPLVLIEATGVCIPIGNSELRLAAVYKSPDRAWSDADVIKLLSSRHKSVLAGDLNAKHPFWNSAVSKVRSCWSCLIVVNLKSQHHKVPLTSLLRGMVTCSILWFTKMSDCQKSLSLTSWTQITYQSSSTYWIMLRLDIFRTRLKNSQIGSGFKALPLI
jgi:hypothetical protein